MMPVVPPPEHLNKRPLDPPEQFCRPFSLAEILSATHNFDESLVIGQGGFGKVYKGIIDNVASIVAIKRLSYESKQGDSEFRTEIEMLSKFRHAHIVSLIGYCYSSTEMILVYQYMVNGSLADHLYKFGNCGSGSTLSWVQRLKICLGAARGLDYLHTGTGVQDSVIHRDMKSSNILLDKNFAAKVSDFGLSRISPLDQSCTHISTNVKGTTGYMDPEYMLTFRLTMKSDVYSFGVVLFEVLCGRRAVDFSLDEEQWSLARWAQYCTEKGTLHRIIDPNLRWEILPESFTEFARIANQCLCYQSKKRPTMTQVVASLELALALQLGHKDSSAFEMEIIGTSEVDEITEKVDSIMVQEDAIKFGSRDKDNNDVPSSHVKPRKRKALSKMLLPFMFWIDGASGLRNEYPDATLNNGSGGVKVASSSVLEANEKELGLVQEGENSTKSNNLVGPGNGNQVEAKWMEQYEPGVYITLVDLRDGTRDIKRVRFSRRRFGEHQAERWWSANREKVYEKYNVRWSDNSSVSSQPGRLSGGAGSPSSQL